MVAVILASIIGILVIGSFTQWYLSLKGNIVQVGNSLEAMQIAQNEYNLITHLSLNELEDRANELKNGYDVGDKYKVNFYLGEKGSFTDDGTCKTSGLTSEDIIDCFDNTYATVSDKKTGKVLYTSRTKPIALSRGVSGTISYEKIIDLKGNHFMGSTCYSDNGYNPFGSDLELTFISPIEGKITLEYTFKYDSDKAPQKMPNVRNIGSYGITINDTTYYLRNYSTGGWVDLGYSTTDGVEHTSSGSFEVNVKKGVNKLTVGFRATTRWNHTVITGYEFEANVLIFKTQNKSFLIET